MNGKVRRVRKTSAPVRNVERVRRHLVKQLKVCFGPCRCYATGKKLKEV